MKKVDFWGGGTKYIYIYILYKSQKDIQKMYNISDFSQIDIDRYSIIDLT